MSKPKSPPPGQVSQSGWYQLVKHVEVEVEELTNGGEGTNEIDIVCLVHHGGRQ